MKYSSGIYATADTTLDDAQTAKLHFVARALGAAPGKRILDIGCGWGSLTLFLASEYGCQVTGVTPSRPQKGLIAERAEALGVTDNVDIRLGRFSDMEVESGYDGVSMLGSIIHMPDRVAVLERAYAAMNPRGKLYVSESCFRNQGIYDRFATRPGTKHVTESIFGFADMVPVSTLVEAVETAGFSLTGLTDLTAHYHRTIEDWERRAVANREEIERAAPGSFDALVKYLQTANAGWGYTTKHYAIAADRSRLGPKGAPA